MKKWCGVDLSKTDSVLFKYYCLTQGICFEPSQVGNDLIHIEVLVDEKEMNAANKYLCEI